MHRKQLWLKLINTLPFHIHYIYILYYIAVLYCNFHLLSLQDLHLLFFLLCILFLVYMDPSFLLLFMPYLEWVAMLLQVCASKTAETLTGLLDSDLLGLLVHLTILLLHCTE